MNSGTCPKSSASLLGRCFALQVPSRVHFKAGQDVLEDVPEVIEDKHMVFRDLPFLE